MMAAVLKEKCRPLRTIQKGSFDLPLEAADAFDLFTAEGERSWVKGWSPLILSDCGGEGVGAVFLTDHGGEQTIWTVIECDRETGRLRYSRVAPGSRAGTVGVEISATGEGSRVTVTYDLTAIGPDGEVAIRAMDKPGYAAMMAEWRRMIIASLS